MGTEIHRGKFSGKVRYALLSTVTMSYRTKFMPRKNLIKEMVKRGFTDAAIKKALKTAQGVIVKKRRGKPTFDVSFPVYQLSLKNLKPQRIKKR